MNKEFLDTVIENAFNDTGRTKAAPTFVSMCLKETGSRGINTFGGLLELYASGHRLEDQQINGADAIAADGMACWLEAQDIDIDKFYEQIKKEMGVDMDAIFWTSDLTMRRQNHDLPT